MKTSICIVGYGSIGKRHHEVLKNYFKENNIIIITKQKNIKNSFKNLSSIINLQPKYIIICNETSKHLNTIKFIENNFKNKIVLVEKPLFVYYNNFIPKKNKYYVGYNMRFNPILNYIKLFLKNKKTYNVNIICGSYLPDWRKTRDYTKSYSASKKKGGGVLLDLSHELDYIRWLYGDYEIKYSSIKKISNLKINTEDYADILLFNKKKIHINLSLNYFSKINKREISINGEDFSLLADLIKKNIEISYKNRMYKKKFNFDRNKSYLLQANNLLNKRNKLCDYNEGIKLMKIIDSLRSS